MSDIQTKVGRDIALEDQELEGEESLEPGNVKMDREIDNINRERVQFSIYELKRRFDRRHVTDHSSSGYVQENLKNQLILDSDFQRQEVWNRRQRSELVESVLLGLPLPLMYFYEDKNANLIVVDGRQRLTAFFNFMDNKFALTELNILTRLKKKRFKDLDSILQSKLEDFQLVVEIIKPPTPDEVRFHIFDRVNRGGTPLNNQEMRNALYQGSATKILKQIAESEQFLEATNRGVSPKRMKDRYIILRALAFYLWRRNSLKDEWGKPVEYKAIDDFLGKTMEFLNLQTGDFVQELENKMLRALQSVAKIGYGDMFRLSKGERRSPINMSIFEVWMYLMLLLDGQEVTTNWLLDQYEKLLSDEEFRDSIGNHRDSLSKVLVRFGLVESIVKGEFGNDQVHFRHGTQKHQSSALKVGETEHFGRDKFVR